MREQIQQQVINAITDNSRLTESIDNIEKLMYNRLPKTPLHKEANNMLCLLEEIMNSEDAEMTSTQLFEAKEIINKIR